jgi:drug/metabolite transporter (DMT)-like permease
LDHAPDTDHRLDLRRGAGWTVAGAFWAAAYLIPYKAAAEAESAAAVVLPMLLWAAVLTSIAGAYSLPKQIDRRSCIVAVALAVLTIIGNQAIAEALSVVEPGIVSVLLRTQVLLVAMIGWWFLRERVTVRFWAGTFLALAGTALIKRLAGDSFGPALNGILWALLGALSFALMQVIIRRVIHRIDPILVNGLRLWLAVLLLLCWPDRLSALLALSGRAWLLTGAAALVGPFLSRLCLMWALRHIPVAHSTLITLVGPVFAFALGFLFLGSVPSLIELIGSLVILAGIALPVVEMARGRHTHQRRSGKRG